MAEENRIDGELASVLDMVPLWRVGFLSAPVVEEEEEDDDDESTLVE